MQRKLADSEFGLTGQKLFLYLAANVDHLEQKWPFWPPLLSLHTDEDYCNWHSGNQLISKESNIGQYSICFIRTMCLHESDLWRKLGVLIKFPDHWKIDLDKTIYCEQLILCLKLKLTVFIHPSVTGKVWSLIVHLVKPVFCRIPHWFNGLEADWQHDHGHHRHCHDHYN